MIATILSELTAWSKFSRDNFQVLLLTFLYLTVLIGILHMGHDAADQDNIAFAREVATGVGGCLFGFLKGRQDRIVPDGSSSVTTITSDK